MAAHCQAALTGNPLSVCRLSARPCDVAARGRLPGRPRRQCYPDRRPVDEYLPTFRLIRAKRSFTTTMRHLLTRTARRGDTQRVALVRDTLRLLGVLVTYPLSRRPVRLLAGEAVRSLPGDELVADAKIGWSHAITIRARPADIWPWLVQMGCRRGGWYSYDGLDNGGVRSAERIVPELQAVQVGDIFPMTPQAQDRFAVRVVEPDRALVLGDDAGQMSWAFVLEPTGGPAPGSSPAREERPAAWPSG